MIGGCFVYVWCVGGGIVYFDFNELCDSVLGVVDYIVFASIFNFIGVGYVLILSLDRFDLV